MRGRDGRSPRVAPGPWCARGRRAQGAWRSWALGDPVAARVGDAGAGERDLRVARHLRVRLDRARVVPQGPEALREAVAVLGEQLVAVPQPARPVHGTDGIEALAGHRGEQLHV